MFVTIGTLRVNKNSPGFLWHRSQVLLQLNDMYLFFLSNSQCPCFFISSQSMSLSKHFSPKETMHDCKA